jgi:hypothetical protein
MPDTCLVTGTVVDSTFSILPFQTVVFRPVGPPLVSAGGDLLVRTLASAVADASGSIAKNVVPGEYVLETMGSEGVVTASCLVPNAATAALADCVAAAGEVLTPDLVQQSLDARDAAQAFALAAEAARDLALAGSPYRLGTFAILGQEGCVGRGLGAVTPLDPGVAVQHALQRQAVVGMRGPSQRVPDAVDRHARRMSRRDRRRCG